MRRAAEVDPGGVVEVVVANDAQLLEDGPGLHRHTDPRRRPRDPRRAGPSVWPTSTPGSS